MVHVETTPGGTPGRVHLVAGSTQSGGGVRISLNAGESGLQESTSFRFFASGSISAAVMASDGTWAGRLARSRLPEIEAAIKASRLVALKRMVASS